MADVCFYKPEVVIFQPWMLTKFGVLVDFDFLKAVTSTNAKPKIVISGRGCNLEKLIWRHIFAVAAQIRTKFVSLVQNNIPITAKWSRSKPEVVFQYGGRLFYRVGSKFSATNWDMSKFGALVEFDFLKAVTSTNVKPEVVLSGRGRRVEK